MSALSEKLEKMNDRFKVASAVFEENIVLIREMRQSERDRIHGKIEEIKKKAEEAKANVEVKKNDTAEKIHLDITDAKAKIEALKNQKDKEQWEKYINSLSEYAEMCEALAVELTIEAQSAMLLATAEELEKREKFGE